MKRIFLSPEKGKEGNINEIWFATEKRLQKDSKYSQLSRKRPPLVHEKAVAYENNQQIKNWIDTEIIPVYQQIQL